MNTPCSPVWTILRCSETRSGGPGALQFQPLPWASAALAILQTVLRNSDTTLEFNREGHLVRATQAKPGIVQRNTYHLCHCLVAFYPDTLSQKACFKRIESEITLVHMTPCDYLEEAPKLRPDFMPRKSSCMSFLLLCGCVTGIASSVRRVFVRRKSVLCARR